MRLPSLALLLVVCPALAQDDTTALARDRTVVTAACPSGTDFEAAGYSIRDVRVQNPFEFLPWIGSAVRQARSQVSHLRGAPYKNQEVTAAENDVYNIVFLPDAPDERIIINLMVTSVENCSGKQLDLTFWMLSSQIAPVVSSTFESSVREETTPQSSAGADAVRNKLQIFPSAGYNRTDRLYAGGSAQYSGRFPLGNFRVEGVASTSMHKIDAALSGSHDGAGWLAHSQWELDYQSNSEPSLNSRLGQNLLRAQFSALSRGPAPLRFGASLEGGNLQSSSSAGVPMPVDTVGASGYGSLKLFLGTTGRWQKTDNSSLGKAMPFDTFAGSYGVELGSTTAGSSLSWVKHIADFANDLTLPFGDHRCIELESRLTAGFIQVRTVIPLAARFFGGNRFTPFIAGDDWILSSQPFIRSIPANRLATTSEGLGGTRFVSFNSTVSLATWRFPLVPSEVTNNQDFRQQLSDAFDTIISTLDVGYRTKDKHYIAMVSNLPGVQSNLKALKEAVEISQTTATPQTAPLYKQCLSPIGRATVRVNAALQNNGQPQYGEVSELLQGEPGQPPDPRANWLNKIHQACVNELNAQVQDATIAGAARDLDALHSRMETEFAAIDRTAAARQAKADMVYPKATLNTLLYQVNLFSLSPVLVFDVAHLGPANSDLGTRYAAGGGLRAALVSHVEFTLGYATNPKRLSHEGKGAMFFSIQLKNLF